MIRAIAKSVLSALLFLLVVSYFALPCMTGDSGQFHSVQPQSCNQHKLFKPEVDLCRLMQTLPAQTPLRFLIVLVILAGFGALSITPREDFLWRFKRRWRRFASLPFATSDPPRLPYFAALRDA